MIGIEEAYCNTMISALLHANSRLLDSKIADALEESPQTGKKDTLGLDAIPEIAIAERLKRFDQYAILITEERGQDANPLAQFGPEHERGPRTFFVSDPTDRSSELRKFLQEHPDRSETVSAAIMDCSSKNRWEKSGGTPASITGAFSAITCVRRGLPICSALLNYICQEITVACSAGIFWAPLPVDRTKHDEINVNWLRASPNAVEFGRGGRDERRFVTFLGKKGYSENFIDSNLVKEGDLEALLQHKAPGGPSRVLYLSSRQPEELPIGFIVANGEKIGEWIHWLPFVRFGTMPADAREPALKFFEIFQDRPWTRDGILMSTSPAYSIFKEVNSRQHKVIIDVRRLQTHPNPSRYRSTILLAPATNDWAMQLVQRYGHRPISFFGD